MWISMQVSFASHVEGHVYWCQSFALAVTQQCLDSTKRAFEMRSMKAFGQCNLVRADDKKEPADA
jgi:hypothetical protein